VKPVIKISEYTYNLPDEKIAKYPLPNRDDSRILIFKDKTISESKFSNLNELLPEESILVLNNTKVVPARLYFRKESGAEIEIFCLEPVDPVDYNCSFAAESKCTWLCVAGNAKRWKKGAILFDNHGSKKLSGYDLRATMLEKKEDKYIIEFSWKAGVPFSTIMEMCGNVPIPPYLKRDSEKLDSKRYQTTYAEFRGSVAAPTAGLHFTNRLLDKIKKRKIDIAELCLHVGAGTFIPVKSEYISEHKMHSEPYIISRELLELLLKRGNRNIIAVGTTSMRCLESLYYLGVQCIENGHPSNVEQWDPYVRDYEYSFDESLQALLTWMKSENIDEFHSRTGIIIVPSFQFRCVNILITNFHQPGSTLLLLVAAFAGERWRDIYSYALDKGFRFLSYGDSSLLFR